MGSSRGVERRAKSIRIHFRFQEKACKETLKTNGEPMAPTPANVKYAERLAAEIRDKIRHGTFIYAEYFPDSDNATTGLGLTVSEHLETWIRLQSTLADSTVSAYRIALNFWKSEIGAKTLKSLRHSDILGALSKRPKWTGKTRNNKVSVLRQALELAMRDDLIIKNPLDGLEAAPHQKEPPDPLDHAEADRIIAHMYERYGVQIGAYFEFKFFTGVRTGESLAIRWENIDFHRRQVLVAETITDGERVKRTKTYSTRLVQLNSRAFVAIQRMREYTQLKSHGWVFVSPMTGERWGDDSGPRKRYWQPAVKHLGIRYRSPYNTRHTYATMMLMAGVTPAYAARQLGHSMEMFLRIYSKWIDGGQNTVEMGKIEAGISPAVPRKIAEGDFS